ncbi:immunity protein TriTu family protein [Paenibacillus pabuli]|uniref:immunity protein TriTu family protein n=1 Tax=Paenibacillus pabuli TaxID=1472 RepID=UPI001FFF5DCC|nr:hypothetical protein [Paenibacillus pabuli]UPK42735.1 hypothetical protein KET34_26765 [Paenibacillus pabuli]
MIRNEFSQWAKCQAEHLQSLGISTEPAKQGDVDEHLIPDPSTGFIHESEYAIGQVTVWESKQMEYEVVNIKTEELLIWKYVENIEDDEPDFDEILREYFEVLQSGLKP